MGKITRIACVLMLAGMALASCEQTELMNPNQGLELEKSEGGGGKPGQNGQTGGTSGQQGGG